MRSRRYVLFLLGTLLMAGSAFADIMTYQFSGTVKGFNNQILGPYTFSLTLPNALTGTGAVGNAPDEQFFPGPELVCNACSYISFYSDAVAHGFTGAPSDAFGYGFATGGSEVFFYFAPGAVTTNGVYSNNLLIGQNDATLTVSSAVPEPSVLLLLMPVALTLTRLRGRKPRRCW